eukprot:m.6065 g.6065  ORF g.6065 m.6065 type:complete len:53 (+) comp14849_c0_seq1:86-244(+)
MLATMSLIFYGFCWDLARETIWMTFQGKREDKLLRKWEINGSGEECSARVRR